MSPAHRIKDKYDSLPTAQGRWRARQRAKGLCIACDTPTTLTLCEAHRALAKEYHRRFRANEKMRKRGKTNEV